MTIANIELGPVCSTNTQWIHICIIYVAILRGNHYLSVRLEPRIIVNYGTCARDRPDGSRISGNDSEDSRDE